MRVTLNGRSRVFEPGSTILSALQREGIHVPHLCHDARLKAIGACRLCVVAVRDQPRPVAACTTPLSDGMIIESHSPAIEAERRTLLRLLAWNYPPLEQGGQDNEFIAELRAYGLLSEVSGGGRAGALRDDTHPYIRVDMARCIECFRCQRICDELQGQSTWKVWNRGTATQMLPDSGSTLLRSSCVSCGACVDSCPTGALTDASVLTLGPPTRFTRTTCPYCGVGCELDVGTRAGRIVQIRPVLDARSSKGHLCVKGRYGFGFVHARDRLTRPLLRRGGELVEVSWEEALAFTAARLSALRDAHGPDSLAVLGSARATNEENYLIQKFARVVLGTHNVDCCARVCHAPSAAGLLEMLGTGAATNGYDDIERARTLLVCGANPSENHPVIGARIRQARLRGAHLIVVDPRRTELAACASVHLQPRAGTDVVLLNALAHVIVRENLADRTFVDARVDGYAAFADFVADYPPERAARECDVSAALIRRAARMYAWARPAMSFHGLGVTEHVQGTEAVMALCNLALLTGNLGCAGAGVNPLRGQNNVQGAAHMGCEPHHLPGYAPVEAARARFERTWGTALPSVPGLDLMQMMDAAARGELKALYAVGYDVLLTNPNASFTRAALGKLELLIVQDMFLNEAAHELAHVVFPAASALEKEGTFMNAERRVQRVRSALRAPGEARSDADIVCALAHAMERGRGFDFASSEAVWDEIRSLWDAGAGITYSRMRAGGLQWPCPGEDHPGTPILHIGSFAHAGRAALRQITPVEAPEAPTPSFPLILVTGRKLYQFNAATMTGRTDNAVFQPHDVVDVCGDDARAYGLQQDERARLESRYGSTEIRVNIDDRQRPGEVFATFHTTETFLNQVTGPHRDARTHTPDYKVTAVRLTALRPAAQGTTS